MVDNDLSNFDEISLHCYIHAFSLDSQAQIDNMQANCKTCTYRFLLDGWYETFANGDYFLGLDENKRNLIEELLRECENTDKGSNSWVVSHPCFDDDKIHTSDFFSSMRAKSRAILDVFDWPQQPAKTLSEVRSVMNDDSIDFSGDITADDSAESSLAKILQIYTLMDSYEVDMSMRNFMGNDCGSCTLRSLILRWDKHYSRSNYKMSFDRRQNSCFEALVQFTHLEDAEQLSAWGCEHPCYEPAFSRSDFFKKLKILSDELIGSLNLKNISTNYRRLRYIKDLETELGSKHRDFGLSVLLKDEDFGVLSGSTLLGSERIEQLKSDHESGVLQYLHDEGRDERFTITSSYNVFVNENGWLELWVSSCCESFDRIGKAEEKDLDEEDGFHYSGSSSVEASIIFPAGIEADSLMVQGRVISQKNGYFYNKWNENYTNMYNDIHGSISNLEVTILEIGDAWIDMIIKGSPEYAADFVLRDRMVFESESKRSFG